jgi:hypothetical protein
MVIFIPTIIEYTAMFFVSKGPIFLLPPSGRDLLTSICIINEIIKTQIVSMYKAIRYLSNDTSFAHIAIKGSFSELFLHALQTKTWQLLYFCKRVDRGSLWILMQDGITYPKMYVTKVCHSEPPGTLIFAHFSSLAPLLWEKCPNLLFVDGLRCMAIETNDRRLRSLQKNLLSPKHLFQGTLDVAFVGEHEREKASPANIFYLTPSIGNKNQKIV